MVSFQKKSLTPAKRICFRLKDVREGKGVSVEALAEQTKIDKKYLEALEACDFDALPSGAVYQKNFVKRYLEALAIDPAPFLEQFIEEEIRYMRAKENAHPKKHIAQVWLGNIPSLVRYALVAAVVLVIIGYLAIQVKNIIEPPTLVLLSPENGSVSNQSVVTVQGATETEARVSINGKDIMNNEEGKFDEMVTLRPGLNVITVTAEKKHGKKTTETRYVVLKEGTNVP